MKKTYEIIDATIEHPTEGTIEKEAIVYYIGDEEDTRECYSIRGKVVSAIREGYAPKDDQKDVKAVDVVSLVKSLKPEEIEELKQLLK